MFWFFTFLHFSVLQGFRSLFLGRKISNSSRLPPSLRGRQGGRRHEGRIGELYFCVERLQQPRLPICKEVVVCIVTLWILRYHTVKVVLRER